MKTEFQVTQEMVNAVPKKVLRRFNPILEMIGGMLKKRDSFYYGSTKQKQLMYSQVSKINNFFHSEVCKFAIDFYYDTVTAKNKDYGFEFEINGHLNFVQFHVFSEPDSEHVFGGASEWLHTDELDHHDAGFVIIKLNQRLLQLLQYRQVFHFYIGQKGTPNKNTPEDVVF